MNALFTYLLQATCISGLLYGYYHLALRNRQFHHYNRFYLISAVVLSLLIPFFNIPVYFSKSDTDSSFVLQTLTVISSAGPSEANVNGYIPSLTEQGFAWQEVLFTIYLSVGVLVLVRVILSLLRIRRIFRKNNVEQLADISFINTNEPGTPFSFFRWLFWNRDIPLQSEKGEQIFRHELFHIEQRHSLDVIFLELMTVICWINPFFHLAKKEIKAIHEFLADEFAVKENRKWEYAELLLMQVLKTKQQLVNPFFHNQIKRRIAMITTSKKTSHRYARKLMVLPLIAVASAIFAFSYRNQEKVPTGTARPITVVIDAGHGGADKGAVSPGGIAEKDIVLAIARKIKELNSDPNMTILLTREEDLSTPVKDRTNYEGKVKPEIFLSLHINAAADKASISEKSGIEIYIPREGHAFSTENRMLATIFMNYLNPLYKTAPLIKQAETNIWVLENAGCPAALVELGYIENGSDMALLSDPSGQITIAKNILQSLAQFMVQKSSSDWEERKQKMDRKGKKAEAKVIANNKQRGPAMDSGISIIADTIHYAGDGRKTEAGLYIINGKKMKPSAFAKHFIIAKSLTVYQANNKTAISKYGAEAQDGVMVFEGAQLEEKNPNRVPPAQVAVPNEHGN